MELGLLGVGFLLGVIGAGFGVVVEQVIGQHFADERAKRAIRAEIDENIRRLKTAEETGSLPARPRTSAWERGSDVDLPEDVRAAIVTAYELADQVRAALDIVEDFIAGSASVPPDQQKLVLAQSGTMGVRPRELGRRAREAFEKARAELAKA